MAYFQLVILLFSLTPFKCLKVDEFSKIVGFAKVLVLPPKQLRLPVLGVKVNGKLIFGLCADCMLTSNTDSCTHSDDRKMIKATFATCEIAVALNHGYTLIKVFELWKYASTQFNKSTGNGGIFST